MAQHDMIIADADGATVLADLNDAFEAIATSHKGTGRPATPYAGQLWLDDNTPSGTRWTLYLYDGTDDIAIGEFDTSTNIFYAAATTASADTNTTQIATTAFVLGQAASQSECEAASSTTKFLTPGRGKYLPGVAKAHVLYFYSTGTPTVASGSSLNVSSLTDTGTGDCTVNLTTAFSVGNFVAVTSIAEAGWKANAKATGVGTIQVKAVNTSNALADSTDHIFVAAFGDQ